MIVNEHLKKQINPNSLKNLKPNITSSERGRELGIKSGEAKARNNILKNAAKRVITDDVAEQMLSSVAERAISKGDANAMKAVWEVLGERIDKTELDLGNKTLSAAVTMTSEEKQKAIKEMLKELSNTDGTPKSSE